MYIVCVCDRTDETKCHQVSPGVITWVISVCHLCSCLLCCPKHLCACWCCLSQCCSIRFSAVLILCI